MSERGEEESDASSVSSFCRCDSLDNEAHEDGEKDFFYLSGDEEFCKCDITPDETQNDDNENPHENIIRNQISGDNSPSIQSESYFNVDELRERLIEIGENDKINEYPPASACSNVLTLKSGGVSISSSFGKTFIRNNRRASGKPFKMEAPSAINRRRQQMEIDRKNVIISRKLKEVKPVVVMSK